MEPDSIARPVPMKIKKKTVVDKLAEAKELNKTLKNDLKKQQKELSDEKKASDRFRKWRSKNPEHDMAAEFKALTKIPNPRKRETEMKALIDTFELRFSRAAREVASVRVIEATTDARVAKECTMNWLQVCRKFMLGPHDPESGKRIDAYVEMKWLRRGPLAGKQDVAAAGFPEQARYTYMEMVQEKTRATSKSNESEFTTEVDLRAVEEDTRVGLRHANQQKVDSLSRFSFGSASSSAPGKVGGVCEMVDG